MNQAKLIAALEEIKALAEECVCVTVEHPKPRSFKKGLQTKSHRSFHVDFAKPLRPFMKTYSKGLSGTKKFVLLLSWLTKGNLKKDVALKEIERQWNRMTSLLEMEFNRFSPARAKDNDWVESKKKGFYNLRPNWKDNL